LGVLLGRTSKKIEAGDMGRKKYHYVVIPGNGDPCPQCCQPTQIREHAAITEKHLRQPHYYRRWFYCQNPQCRVTTVMHPRHIVWNPHVKAGGVWGNTGVDMSRPPWE
jgi:hypothetical protein